MIRPGIKADDETLLKEDIYDLQTAKRFVDAAAIAIAKVVQCAPLDRDIEVFKKLGCDTMEISRRISAACAAHQMKWSDGVPLKKAYMKALRSDDSGEHRFYDEILPSVKCELERIAKSFNESEVK